MVSGLEDGAAGKTLCQLPLDRGGNVAGEEHGKLSIAEEYND